MATIDSNIALGVKPLQVENPMNQYAAMSQIQNAQNQNMAAQNQNALAQYQLSAAKRGDEKINFLNQRMAERTNKTTGEIDYPGLYKDVAEGGFGSHLPELIKQQQATKKQEGEIKKQDLELQDLEFNQRIKKANKAVTDIINLNTPQEAIAGVKRHLASGDIDQVKADQLIQSITQTPNFRQWQKTTAMNILDVKDKFEVEHKNRIAATGEKNADTGAGQLKLAQDKFKFETNPELQTNLAEAKAKGEFFGKNKAAAQLALPGAIATAKQTINLIDDMVGKPEIKDKNGKIIQEGTKPRAGFDDYVGFSYLPGQRFIEGSDAASFELRQKQIEGKAFLEAFETLKGGGSITEKEGEKGAAAIMRMNKASSREEYIIAARELQDVLRAGIEIKAAKAGTTNNVASPNKSSGIAPPSGFVPDKKPQ
jgi:hypothetical protein